MAGGGSYRDFAWGDLEEGTYIQPGWAGGTWSGFFVGYIEHSAQVASAQDRERSVARHGAGCSVTHLGCVVSAWITRNTLGRTQSADSASMDLLAGGSQR